MLFDGTTMAPDAVTDPARRVSRPLEDRTFEGTAIDRAGSALVRAWLRAAAAACSAAGWASAPCAAKSPTPVARAASIPIFC